MAPRPAFIHEIAWPPGVSPGLLLTKIAEHLDRIEFITWCMGGRVTAVVFNIRLEDAAREISTPEEFAGLRFCRQLPPTIALRAVTRVPPLPEEIDR